MLCPTFRDFVLWRFSDARECTTLPRPPSRASEKPAHVPLSSIDVATAAAPQQPELL